MIKFAASLILMAILAPPVLADTALDIIRRYNARPIAEKGWQSVDLDLMSGDIVTKHFGVVNAWLDAGDGTVNTLFLLQAPQGLRGTNYLLKEPRRQTEHLNVFLHLPVGLKQVITLKQNQLDEGLLGSDFAYRDIRWLLPEEGMRYELAGREILMGYAVSVVDAVPLPEAAEDVLWHSARFYIADSPVFLFGADYFRGEGASHQLLKQLRVHEITQIDGNWIATRMSMRVDQDRWSRITLNDVSFTAHGYAPEAFLPASLPELGTTLRETGAIPQADGGQAND